MRDGKADRDRCGHRAQGHAAHLWHRRLDSHRRPQHRRDGHHPKRPGRARGAPAGVESSSAARRRLRRGGADGRARESMGKSVARWSRRLKKKESTRYSSSSALIQALLCVGRTPSRRHSRRPRSREDREAWRKGDVTCARRGLRFFAISSPTARLPVSQAPINSCYEAMLPPAGMMPRCRIHVSETLSFLMKRTLGIGLSLVLRVRRVLCPSASGPMGGTVTSHGPPPSAWRQTRRKSTREKRAAASRGADHPAGDHDAGRFGKVEQDAQGGDQQLAGRELRWPRRRLRRAPGNREGREIRPTIRSPSAPITSCRRSTHRRRSSPKGQEVRHHRRAVVRLGDARTNFFKGFGGTCEARTTVTPWSATISSPTAG